MPGSISDQVVDFYYAVFDRIFGEGARLGIPGRLKRDEVLREIQGWAGAASQSLTRFLLNKQLAEQHVEAILEGLALATDSLKLDDVANSNIAPETVVETRLGGVKCPEPARAAGHDAIFRVALHSVVQVLMQVGPVMAQWQNLRFAGTFEPPRRLAARLNQISEQLGEIARSGPSGADESYELEYRDYLLQRFHRVEAGTVRMTTNLDVDLRELFVSPRAMVRPVRKEGEGAGPTATAFMDLAAARQYFGERAERDGPRKSVQEGARGLMALDQVKAGARNVLVGAPGSGKSTFLEWLQLQLSGGYEPLPMAGKQAIPLLLKVRQLDCRNLPSGPRLIQAATASQDRAALMPQDWIGRQMKKGRVFFMLDGLDEAEPELRDGYLIPWLQEMCRQYPNCRYLVSSRPVGYPAGMLREIEFTECDLLDFDDTQILEYTQHWCASVRLARNEPAEEARLEGGAEGQKIVDRFNVNRYIRNLARNPLMLSAICLVNYFEQGELPKDRAKLYKLCVEGLLHNWDQRRGIRSEFGFDEKLRACREVALAMQSEDRAEYEAERVRDIFAEVLGDRERAGKLLEHIRRRTGLLLERRVGVFAFAHLTFQEYLAAQAVYEGNRFGTDAERLAGEHADGRWQEVIALYCGLTPAREARKMIELLIAQPDSVSLAGVLAEAFLSAGDELVRDPVLRRKVLERVAVAPSDPPSPLERFKQEEVAPVANSMVGRIESRRTLSSAYGWLRANPHELDSGLLAKRLRRWRGMNPLPLAELVHLLHAFAPERVLAQITTNPALYESRGPEFTPATYKSQAAIALIGLELRVQNMPASPAVQQALLQALRVITRTEDVEMLIEMRYSIGAFLARMGPDQVRWDPGVSKELAALARQLAQRPKENWGQHPHAEDPVAALNTFADSLDRATAEKSAKPKAKKKAAGR